MIGRQIHWDRVWRRRAYIFMAISFSPAYSSPHGLFFTLLICSLAIMYSLYQSSALMYVRTHLYPWSCSLCTCYHLYHYKFLDCVYAAGTTNRSSSALPNMHFKYALCCGNALPTYCTFTGVCFNCSYCSSHEFGSLEPEPLISCKQTQ